MEEEEAPQRIVVPKTQMVAKFPNVTRKSTESLEDMLKQELMASPAKILGNPLISITCKHPP